MPALVPGNGVGLSTITLYLRDAALWIVPALLPLSTLLYTFSQSEVTIAASNRASKKQRVASAVKLRNSGHGVEQIAELLGVGKATVQNYIREHDKRVAEVAIAGD